MKKHKKKIRRLKLKQFIALIIYILFIAALPIAYALIRTTTGAITINFVIEWSTNKWKNASLSFTFLFTIAFASVHFIGALKRFHEEAEFGMFKQIVTIFHGSLIPLALFTLAFYIGSWKHGSEVFIINGIFIGIAKMVVRPWQLHLNYHLSREIRKQEMREVLNEED